MPDRVRLEANELLVLPDYDAGQTLQHDALGLVLGGLVGNANGCLSPWTYALTDNGAGVYYVTPGAFQFLISAPALTDDGGATYRGWRSQVVTHNPAQGGQVSAMDYTVARAFAVAGIAASAYPFVYAQPVLVEADTAARKKWAAGAQASVSVKTRYRERVSFKLSVAAPDDASNAGWACVGRLRNWLNGTGVPDPGTPSFHPLTWLDSYEKHQNASESGNWYNPLAKNLGTAALALPSLVNVPGFSIIDSDSASKDLGIGQMLALVFSRLQRHLDPDLSKAWFEDPATGGDLKSLKTSVDALTAALAPSVASGAPFVGYAAPINYDNAVIPAYQASAPAGNAWLGSLTSDSTGVIVATMAGTAGGVAATPVAAFVVSKGTVDGQFYRVSISGQVVTVRQYLLDGAVAETLVDGSFYLTVIMKRT